MSKYVVERADSNVRIKGSCGTSSATTKSRLKFGIRNVRQQIIPIALEVLVPDLGASIFLVGALAEKGVKCDFFSSPPAIIHESNVFPLSTEVPRMYIINRVVDGMDFGRAGGQTANIPHED